MGCFKCVDDFGVDSASFRDFHSLFVGPVAYFGEVNALGGFVCGRFWWVKFEELPHSWDVQNVVGDHFTAFVAYVHIYFLSIPSEFLIRYLDIFAVAKVAKFNDYIFISHENIIFIKRDNVKVLGIFPHKV